MNDALLALDPSARTLRSDGLRAVFLPGRGMLGASLQHRGEEMLGRLEDMASFAEGYRYAQVFAPRGKDYIAIEPMTAPANALVSGWGLRLVEPGGLFRATFRVTIQ